MSIRAKMLLTAALPAALGVAFWSYAASSPLESDGRWLFALGFMAFSLAGTVGRNTWLRHRVDELDGELTAVRQRLDDLEEKVSTNSARLAIKDWHQAGLRGSAIRAGNRQLQVVDHLNESS